MGLIPDLMTLQLATRRLVELDDRADRELDRLITKRHNSRDGDALLEPTYAESVRRYNACREEEHRSEWGNFRPEDGAAPRLAK